MTQTPVLSSQGKPKVAFVCNHNSCRSQMAEALGILLASDVFESHSAGTEIKDHINPDAVRLMKKIYDVDMEATQYNKVIDDIPAPDVVIFMGCNVQCPYLSAPYSENWGLDDPSDQDDATFTSIIKQIEDNVLRLKELLRKK